MEFQTSGKLLDIGQLNFEIEQSGNIWYLSSQQIPQELSFDANPHKYKTSRSNNSQKQQGSLTVDLPEQMV